MDKYTKKRAEFSIVFRQSKLHEGSLLSKDNLNEV
jgi:hypothetical protein